LLSFRSILMGSLVVLMGMAAGLLLSLVIWPPSPPTSQGLVTSAVPALPAPPVAEPPAVERGLGVEPEAAGKEPEEQRGSTITFSPQAIPSAPQATFSSLEERAGEAAALSHGATGAETLPEGRESPGGPSRMQRKDSGRKSSPVGARSGISQGESAFSFTLHVESFKSAQAAQKRVNGLKDLGLDAFSRPAQVAGKGLFHRVFVGRFQDRTSAREFLERLKAQKLVSGGRVMSRSEMGG
jgi:cell division septation protein DedD